MVLRVVGVEPSVRSSYPFSEGTFHHDCFLCLTSFRNVETFCIDASIKKYVSICIFVSQFSVEVNFTGAGKMCGVKRC